MAKSKYRPKPTWKIPTNGTVQSAPQTAAPVRLSQCMIVKNEEKNIEKALSWGKDIVCEQIVVDTGSTDRTVEIAERMGAKVYHFAWINDFSAAKNYAIDQAAGNWIAFLDADEYFSAEDAQKLLPLLQSIDSNPDYDSGGMLGTAMAHLNDQGKPFQITRQYRLFRNLPDLRYVNPIHENLACIQPGKVYDSLELDDSLTVIHTGYAAGAYHSTNKLQRNIDALRHQRAQDPDDLLVAAYLADSLMATGEFDYAEVEALCKEVIAVETPTTSGYKVSLLQNAQCRCFGYLFMLYLLQARSFAEIQALYGIVSVRYPDFPDCDYYMGEACFQNNHWEEAIACYRRAEQNGDAVNTTNYISRIHTVLPNLYLHTATCYEKLGDMPNAIRYGTLMLKLTPYNEEFLYNYVGLSLGNDPVGNAPAMLNVLRQLYDFSNLKDKLLLLKVAARLGNQPLYDLVYAEFTPEEKAWFENK